MKLFIEILRLIINKFILRKSNGECVHIFCTHMGLVYIKLGQILAVQNINNLFTEDDRQKLISICGSCNTIEFKDIQKILDNEYGNNKPYKYIYKEPIGSASVSQVHKAILHNNCVVALKVKRNDITKTIEKDLEQIKFCVKHFGKLLRIENLIGSYKALDFYLQWIQEEIDFKHEIKNIDSYTNFANKVNNKVSECKHIVLPKVYKEYCTENIIVMEYVSYKTISELQPNKSNSNRINDAMESYIKLSFYALFNNIGVVWHGDPHAGNIYIDNDGNVGFLDMGLIFELTPEEQNQTLEYFFCAYFGDYVKLFELLEPYIQEQSDKKEKFRVACKIYCANIKNKPITCYFMDLVWVCLEYNINPPDFLYGMAKAFICLFGMDTVYNHTKTGKEVIEKQVIEYIIRTTANKGKRYIKLLEELSFSLMQQDITGIANNIYDIKVESKFITNIIKNIHNII